MANEQPVQLQTDTLSNLPGGGVRTITATILVNGVPTSVQMQVVSVADEFGRLLVPDYDATSKIVMELRRIQELLCIIAQEPDLSIGTEYERND